MNRIIRRIAAATLYYLGHFTCVAGLTYWYFPPAYNLYQYLMRKSSEIDIYGDVWTDND